MKIRKTLTKRITLGVPSQPRKIAQGCCRETEREPSKSVSFTGNDHG